VTNLILNGDVNKELKKELDTIHLNTKFNFLKTHNGFRPGKLHLFLAPTGSGKSTLVRSLIKDLLETGLYWGDALVWLSEETVKDFQIEWSRTRAIESVNNVCIESELEIDSMRLMMTKLGEQVKRKDVEILIFDNITTSSMYADKKPHEQAALVKGLKRLASSTNKPIIIIAHTNAEVHENMSGLINEQQIRGSKTIVSESEFMYIMQRFKVGESIQTTIRLRKYRGYALTETMFLLNFNIDEYIFDKDYRIDFDEFKRLYKLRNTLRG